LRRRKGGIKAMLVSEKHVQQIALDDLDLKALWDSMSTSVWKRAD
jgi:hypothetical protein